MEHLWKNRGVIFELPEPRSWSQQGVTYTGYAKKLIWFAASIEDKERLLQYCCNRTCFTGIEEIVSLARFFAYNDEAPAHLQVFRCMRQVKR